MDDFWVAVQVQDTVLLWVCFVWNEAIWISTTKELYHDTCRIFVRFAVALGVTLPGFLVPFSREKLLQIKLWPMHEYFNNIYNNNFSANWPKAVWIERSFVQPSNFLITSHLHNSHPSVLEYYCKTLKVLDYWHKEQVFFAQIFIWTKGHGRNVSCQFPNNYIPNVICSYLFFRFQRFFFFFFFWNCFGHQRWFSKSLFPWLQIAKREEDQDEDERDAASSKPASGMRLKVPGSRA